MRIEAKNPRLPIPSPMSLEPFEASTGVVEYVGSRVKVERDDGRKETYRIVGMDEADPKRGTLSYVSPLAQALMDREVGDRIEVGGTRREIIEIS